MALSWQSVKPTHQVLIGASIGIMALIASFCLDKWTHYNDALELTEDSARRTAELLAQHTARVVDGVDSALRETQRIREDAEAEDLDPITIHRMLKAVHGGNPVLRTIGWVDGEGYRLATSETANPPPLNISHTIGFKVLRSVNDPSAPPYVSQRFYSSVLDSTAFFVGHSIAAPNGAFAGLVYGTVDPSYFIQVFEAADLGLNAVVTLSRFDGSILAQNPPLASEEAAKTPAFAPESFGRMRAGILPPAALGADPDRIVGFSVTGDQRFVLTVAVTHEQALAGFMKELVSGLWRLTLSVGLLVMIAVALFVQLRKREAVAQELRDNEARFRDFAEASGDWFWETDSEHRMVWMSKAVEDASRVSEQWHMGKRRIDMCARELMATPAAIQDHQRTLDMHLPFSDFEYPRRSPSGIRWIRTSGVPVFDEEGDFTGYRGSARDITDIIDAKERLKDATDALPGGFMLFNDADELIYHNAATQQPTGLGFIERLGDTFETIVRRSIDLGMVEEAQDNPEAWIRWRMKRHFAANSTTLVHINGRAIEMVERKTSDGGRVVLRFDVTDREMAYEEIRRARDAAYAASRAKSDFLASMSHELRTPLNAIIGFGEILQRSDRRDLTHEQVNEYSGYIVSSGHLLLSLVNDVLDLSTVEAGHMKVTLEQVDVREMIDRAAESVRPLAEQQRIDLQVEVGRDAGYARADRQRATQVLLNLLSNAIKYNRQGGFVKVRVERDGNQMAILVTDSGRGISAQKAARLFSPFERLGAEFGNIEGTGIGLALCKKLISAMDGEIGYQPAQPSGSTFWVTLPLGLEKDTTRGASTSAAVPRLTSRAADITVLCIEDNPINMRTVEHALVTRGNVTFVEAETGREGIELAASLQPDVILLDLNLPDLSGQDVLVRLLATPETRHIPVIALTASAMPDDVAKGLASGFFRYLAKPLDMDALDAALEAAMSRQAEPQRERRTIPARV